ncbi:hypothetical protein [Marinobacter sp. SS21]|uniref:hypothetical protein n=1 Tax=Marinobacter sp. SS21 TaxID=2979460 RepID=UPI00232F600D|nr:hypothetical protein [Marinobacter sp. SS21]MDC0662366.1 hypothetical protein [Marinobacter sp. SS21]
MPRPDANVYRTLAAQYGSPLYVYDLDRVTEQVGTLRKNLPTGAGLYYSLKANPLPSLVQSAVAAGCHLEVTSPNELAVAAQAVASTDHLLYGGPGKTEAELSTALLTGVRRFSIESWTDMERLHRIAGTLGLQVQVLLRINPSDAVASGLAMSGADTQFGFCEEELLDQKPRLDGLAEHIEVTGFHVYYGTQIGSVDKIADSVEFAIASIERLSEALDLSPSILDLGGGFPWPYGKLDEPPSLHGLRPALEAILAKRRRSARAEIWFESGRFVAAASGTLLATVLDLKQRASGECFLVLDAGINHLGGMSGLGRLPRAGFQFQPLQASSREQESARPATIVGPLCSPLDCLARKTSIPQALQVGDLISVPNVGAYGLTASLLGFLSRPAPIEIALRDGRPVALHQWRHGHDRLQSAVNTQSLTEELI